MKEKELKKLLQRDQELDLLFERLYEDNVSGKITDDRYSRMSANYEAEQAKLSEGIKRAGTGQTLQSVNADRDVYLHCP